MGDTGGGKSVSASELLQQLLQERERVATLETQMEEKTRELFFEKEKIQTTNRYLSKVLDTAESPIFAADGDLHVETFNRTTYELFGFSKDELAGLPLINLFSAKEYERIFGGLQEQKWQDFHGETEMLGKDGVAIPVMLSASKMGDSAEDIEGIVCICQDLRDYKMMEVKLLQSQKMESVGVLAAGIAHEINTPIQYIRDNMLFFEREFDAIRKILEGYQLVVMKNRHLPELAEAAEALQKEEGQKDLPYLLFEIPNAISQTLEGAQSVARIVRAMKEFAHPGSEEKVPVDLNSALQSTMVVSHNEWKYVADVSYDLDPKLPAVMGYPGELNQAFLNLIVNAAHAISDATGGGKSGKGIITVRTRFDDTHAIVEVADTGAGIPDEIKSRIFEPFFTTKGVGKGTGQGLTIVYSSIVKKHEGLLDFQSKIGKGTIFTVRLPRIG